MSGRELVVLGTASQVPTRTRNHNGYLLRWDSTGILFDPGEGTQRQLTHAGVPASAVDVICITHAHGDHCLGLPGVVQRRVLDGARTPVHLYYPAAASTMVDALLVASGPAAASVVRHPVEGGGLVHDAGTWRLSCAELDHRVPALGWRVDEPDGRRVLPERAAALGVRGPAVGALLAAGSLEVEGRRVTVDEVTVPRPGQSFALVMDTRPCPGAVEVARGATVLVCESTFLEADAELAQAYAHCTAAQAAGIARDAGAEQLLLTHFSQRYGDDVEGFAEEARPVFGRVQALRDLERMTFPRRR
ncbi:ribonuclease Z [Motilibacter peucedani]|uniref:Ribonuclease Z n=1 Tax=Motilibacter peucedani TaxID=598650 RepID=A0A420XKM5_9ACTN|nr:ribonuclease Z [Motilibacter peucedani]RKS68576.1 ribonuclease Z [Motilibacter peucedani]